MGLSLAQSLIAHELKVAVVSVRRARGAVVTPDHSLVLEAGDTLVLSGRPQDLTKAESLLLKG